MAILAKKAFRSARWKAAQAWLKLWPNVDVVGVAGSVGKTTVKEMVAAVLGQRFRVVKTSANWDPIFNLPITSFSVFGVDGIGQMDKYLTLVHPRVGVLTRLSLEHTDKEHFGSLEMAVKEETKLLTALPPYGWAVLNGDDKEIRRFANIATAHKIFYGFGANNDLGIISFRQKIAGSRAVATFEVRLDTGQVEKFTTNLLGKQNALCACAGIAVGIIMGMSFEDIQKGLLTVHPVPGRLEPKTGKWGSVIDDAYNASPAAVEAAVDVLVDLDPHNGVLILGDMLELGRHARESHRAVGRYAKDIGVKALAAHGEFANDVVEGYGKGEHTLVAETHEEIVGWVNTMAGGTILVKGSHGMRMEKVVVALTGQ